MILTTIGVRKRTACPGRCLNEWTRGIVQLQILHSHRPYIIRWAYHIDIYERRMIKWQQLERRLLTPPRLWKAPPPPPCTGRGGGASGGGGAFQRGRAL